MAKQALIIEGFMRVRAPTNLARIFAVAIGQVEGRCDGSTICVRLLDSDSEIVSQFIGDPRNPEWGLHELEILDSSKVHQVEIVAEAALLWFFDVSGAVVTPERLASRETH